MAHFAQPPYAHTLPGEPPAKWERLSHHLACVADLAAMFTDAFGADKWGRLLGHCHDLGKWSAAFQNYLVVSHGDADAGEEATKAGRVDHSTFGARYALTTFPGPAGQILAFCIAGHHTGLADADDDSRSRSTLAFKLDSSAYAIEPVELPPVSSLIPLPILPLGKLEPADVGFAIAFFTRMLFSALIDADRTATEAFCNPAQSIERSRPKPSLDDLRPMLDAFLDGIQHDAPPSPVNRIRARVLSECLAAAPLPPGFFSLNVPTGGGKTFASLAFALHHARHHPTLRRVVVAIPFTSIIEQTADQYRAALGSHADCGLVEHHSSLNPRHDTRQNKLATENWDAPLIVTTNVQLFESLFAAGTTPARKLHRLANTVIVLDEAQTMPVDLLTPTLAALRELVARYGCSVVLCTATQPALEHRTDFAIGLHNVRPIITDTAALHLALKRVEIVRLGKLTDDQLVSRLATEPRVLCLVNTKAHAAKVYDGVVAALGSSAGCFHLSTFMCAQHRRDVLARIRQRLKDLQPCRIISTQLIEAGVDIDLPVVYRAPAGFDSIAQAAGRCNREGNRRDLHGTPLPGTVYVFDTEQFPPPGLLRSAAQVSAELSSLHPDPLAPSAVEAYFKALYWSRSHEWDKHHVMDCFPYDPHHVEAHRKLAPFRFRAATEAYELIRDQQTPILVPYNADAQSMIDHVFAGRPIDFAFFRAAQKYIVSVRDDFLYRSVNNAVLVQHEAGLWALTNSRAYSPETGMLPNVAGIGPESLFI